MTPLWGSPHSTFYYRYVSLAIMGMGGVSSQGLSSPGVLS